MPLRETNSAIRAFRTRALETHHSSTRTRILRDRTPPERELPHPSYLRLSDFFDEIQQYSLLPELSFPLYASAELLFDFRDFGDGEFDPFLCLPFDIGNELRGSLLLELVVSGIAKP
jgi:hypothetical protein